MLPPPLKNDPDTPMPRHLLVDGQFTLWHEIWQDWHEFFTPARYPFTGPGWRQWQWSDSGTRINIPAANWHNTKYKIRLQMLKHITAAFCLYPFLERVGRMWTQDKVFGLHLYFTHCSHREIINHTEQLCENNMSWMCSGKKLNESVRNLISKFLCWHIQIVYFFKANSMKINKMYKR